MEFILGYPTGVPLGGIGTGIIEMRADGRVGTVGCNNNWSVPLTETPGSFFAVKLKDGTEEIRLLQKEGEEGWRGMDRVGFQAEFPFARVTYASANPPFCVKLEAFGPHVPHREKDSCIPGAMFEFSFENPQNKPLSLCLYVSWEHLSGCGALRDGTKKEDRTGNRIVPFSKKTEQGLLFLPGKGTHAPVNAVGEYVLTAKKCPQAKLSCHWWNVLEGKEGFLRAIQEDFPEPIPKGQEGVCHPAGILAFDISIPAGGSLSLPVALSWYMPRHIAGGAAGMDGDMCARLAPLYQGDSFADEETKTEMPVNYGHFYENFFSGALDAAEYLLENRERLRKESSELSSFLSGTGLEGWIARKLVNDDAPMVCNSILTKNGTLATLEACRGMGGALGTNDQRMIAHAAYQLFFPEWNRSELGLFAAVQAADGHIPHFCGNVHQRIGSSEVSYGNTLWPDLSCSFIFQCWRDYLCTGDKNRFLTMLPHIRRAYEWLKTADQDNDGVPEGGSTWDVEPHEGLFSYTGTVWLAILRILQEIAEAAGETAWKQEVCEWFEKAQQSVLALYNGVYFRKLYNPVTGKDSDEIFVGQVAGEWMVRLLGLESVLPEKMVQSALKTIYKYNGNTSRYMLAPIKVTAQGNLADRNCAEQAWPQYTMVFADCLAMYLGMDEGMENLRHFDNVVVELIQAPCTTTLWHNAVTGLPNWGSIDRYMNTPAVWFVLNAMTGFHPLLHENALRIDRNGYGFRKSAVLPLLCSAFWAKMIKEHIGGSRERISIVFEKVFYPLCLGRLRIGGCRQVTGLKINTEELLFTQSKNSREQVLDFACISVKIGDTVIIELE